VRLNSENRPLPLLHIDDSANERQLVRKAILISNTPFAFHEAHGIESAIPFFQSHGHDLEPRQHPRPALVLLDYDMGKHTGADFLIWLRVRKRISSIPVIMFSGSVERDNIAECYQAGANYFLSKPRNFARLNIILRTLHRSLAFPHKHSPILLLDEYIPDPSAEFAEPTPLSRPSVKHIACLRHQPT
jgi:CheY-like chemotaxis protein